MAMRDGKDYLTGPRDGREIWIDGERVLAPHDYYSRVYPRLVEIFQRIGLNSRRASWATTSPTPSRWPSTCRGGTTARARTE